MEPRDEGGPVMGKSGATSPDKDSSPPKEVAGLTEDEGGGCEWSQSAFIIDMACNREDAAALPSPANPA